MLHVHKQRLGYEFHRVRESLEDYRRLLTTAQEGADGEHTSVAGLRAQHLALLEARVSLGSVELACALLRHLLGRLSIETLRFSASANVENTASPVLDDNPIGEEPPASGLNGDLSEMVGGLKHAVREAPLEVHDRLHRVLGTIVDLFASLADESADRVDRALIAINLATANTQSRNLLRELAAVTRDVYNALNSAAAELPLDRLTESSGGITEAVQRLNSVVSRLDDAATQNLDHLERVNEIAHAEADSLSGVIETLRSAQKRLMLIKTEHPALDPILTELQDRLSDEVGAPTMTLRHHLIKAGEQHLELISNQSFQELTGRTLRRIIEFVQTIEADLYDILRQFRPGSVPARTRPVSDTPEDNIGSAKQSQQDVDKLLEEMGF